MKKYQIEIKWGILFTLVMLAWMYFEKLMGWHDRNIANHAIFTNLFAIPAITLYVFALINKREKYYKGKMNWLQGFLSGVIIGVIVTILSPLAQVITLKIITPDYFQNAIAYAVSQQKLTLYQAKEYFSMNNYLIQAAIGSLAMGAITGAIVAIFVRKI